MKSPAATLQPYSILVRVGLLLLLHLFFCSSPLLAQTLDVSQLYQRASGSVGGVTAMDAYDRAFSWGSGFLIGPTAFVTNYHVIEGSDWVTIKLGDAEPIRVNAAFGVARERDLAILRLPKAGPPLQFSLNEPTVGERVIAIGDPLGMEASVSEGIVSGIRSMYGMDFYQITSPISPGSSGGPILNRFGQVIGVATLTLEHGQNLNFAIPAAAVDELWKASSEKTVILETLSVSPFESLQALLRQALLANPFMSALDWLLNRL